MTTDTEKYQPTVGDDVHAVLKGRITAYDADMGVWTLVTDGSDHVPWTFELHWAQPFTKERD